MAKGNMLLGYSRGSVGDVVMSRVKGQQVSKARNRKPANPKSKRQMAQRSSFINPVKFYTHGVQALFKFAFSDKKVTESDFNAFMRNNSKVSFPVTKAEFDNPGFPALGNYMMTKGKLPEIPVSRNDEYPNFLGIDVSGHEDPQTIGQLSTAFIKMGYAEEGDIITLVVISEHNVVFDGATLELLPSSKVNWDLRQFVVDTASAELVEDVLPGFSVDTFEGVPHLVMDGYDESPEYNLLSFAIVRSRETALGLEVSTSYLHNGGYIDQYIAHRNTKAEVAKVLVSWGASAAAILQGSIAKK